MFKRSLCDRQTTETQSTRSQVLPRGHMSDTKRVRTASTGLSAEPLNFKGQMSKITFPVCNNLRKLAVAGDEVVEGLGGGVPPPGDSRSNQV